MSVDLGVAGVVDNVCRVVVDDDPDWRDDRGGGRRPIVVVVCAACMDLVADRVCRVDIGATAGTAFFLLCDVFFVVVVVVLSAFLRCCFSCNQIASISSRDSDPSLRGVALWLSLCIIWLLHVPPPSAVPLDDDDDNERAVALLC